MRIGIVGPPGAEKSKFARALAKEFDLKIVDHYVQKLQRDTNLALGPWASYAENFMIAGLRLQKEYAVGEEDRITSGTILDTLAYMAIKTDHAIQNTPEEIRATNVAAQGAMSGITLMYQESWDYHLTFHLPLGDKATPGWERNLDYAINTVIDSYYTPYLYTLSGTTDERIKIATEIINLAKENQDESTEEAETTEVDEQAV